MSEEPESEGGSRTAGGCFLTVLGIGAVAVLLRAAPVAGILTVWGVGGVVLWWAVNRRNKIENPSPTVTPEVVEEEKPQFRSVPDPDNDHHTFIVWTDQKES